MALTDLTALEKLFLALADKTRLRLVALMADGEVSVGYLADQLGESQPKISRHLAYLRSTGLASTRRDGKWVYYGIEKQADSEANFVLAAILSAMMGKTPKPLPVSISDRETHSIAIPDPDESKNADRGDYIPNELEIYLL